MSSAAGNLLLDAVSVCQARPSPERAAMIRLTLSELAEQLRSELRPDGSVTVDATALIVGAVATIDHLVHETATAMGMDAHEVIADARAAIEPLNDLDAEP